MVVEMTCVDLSAFWIAKAETATTKVRIVQSRRATGNDKRQACAVRPKANPYFDGKWQR